MIKFASVVFGLLWSMVALSDEQMGLKEVLIDNSQVQVVRLTYPPGAQSGMHGHDYPNRVVYVIRGGQLEFVSENGNETRVLSVADGDAMFVPASIHNVRNIGSTEVVLVETEVKQ